MCCPKQQESICHDILRKKVPIKIYPQILISNIKCLSFSVKNSPIRLKKSVFQDH